MHVQNHDVLFGLLYTCSAAGLNCQSRKLRRLKRSKLKTPTQTRILSGWNIGGKSQEGDMWAAKIKFVWATVSTNQILRISRTCQHFRLWQTWISYRQQKAQHLRGQPGLQAPLMHKERPRGCWQSRKVWRRNEARGYTRWRRLLHATCCIPPTQSMCDNTLWRIFDDTLWKIFDVTWWRIFDSTLWTIFDVTWWRNIRCHFV